MVTDRVVDTTGPLLVQDEAGLAEVVDALCHEDRYGFDTEFHHEKTYVPHLALIQLSWRDQVALIDPLAVDVAPLATVLQGPGLAIAHAAGQDIGVLQTACGVVPARLFDTQVAAGFLGMSTPSLSRLTERMLGVNVPKGDRLTDWVKRPLTPNQISYAAGDVAHLLTLHDVMAERLQARGRLQWALEECSELLRVERREIVPEEAWWKMSGFRSLRGRSRGVAQEVAAWRERRAAALDVPRRTVLGDLPLSAIVHAVPDTRRKLEAVRGIDGRHLARGAAEEILQAIQRGRDLPPDQLRLPPRRREDDQGQAVVTVAAGLVAQTAADEEIDTLLLATRADLFDLVAGQPSRLDHGWRRRLVGDPVLRLVRGELAVAFDGSGGLVLEERSHRPTSA